MKLKPYNQRDAERLDTRTSFECPKCTKEFKPTKNYQIFCSEECENYHDTFLENFNSEKLKGYCPGCGREVRLTNYHSSSQCHTCRYSKIRKKVKEEQIQLSLKKNEEGKKRKKGLSLTELNRRAEYKRVFDEDGWDHYLKGRRWDKI